MFIESKSNIHKTFHSIHEKLLWILPRWTNLCKICIFHNFIFNTSLRQHLYDICSTLFQNRRFPTIMHEASLVETCTYKFLTSCDDCSTRNVQVWTTSYDLASYSFVGSNRYLSLWSIKVSETYATKIFADKDDSTIIHVI